MRFEDLQKAVKDACLDLIAKLEVLEKTFNGDDEDRVKIIHEIGVQVLHNEN